MMENGRELGERGKTTSPVRDLGFPYQLYLQADPAYSGRVRVPTLRDKEQQTIVSKESSDMIRMFNQEFDHLTGNRANFCPADLTADLEAVMICSPEPSGSTPNCPEFSGVLSPGNNSQQGPPDCSEA
jgi:putative glutathione S-transferase